MALDTPIYSNQVYKPGSTGWQCHPPYSRRRRLDFLSHQAVIKRYCRSQATIYDNTNNLGGTINIKGNACNSWDCEYCRRIKSMRLKTRIDKGISKETWRFLTLTIDPKLTSKEDALLQISWWWDKFAKRLRRQFKDVKFIRVIEFHASGYPHLHVILNKYIYKPWIVANWCAVGGGKIVDIGRVKHAKVGKYVSGYLSHRDSKHHRHDEQFYSYSIRRFAFSRNFDIARWEKRTIIFTKGIDWDCSLDLFDCVVHNCYSKDVLFAVKTDKRIKYINLKSSKFKIVEC